MSIYVKFNYLLNIYIFPYVHEKKYLHNGGGSDRTGGGYKKTWK